MYRIERSFSDKVDIKIRSTESHFTSYRYYLRAFYTIFVSQTEQYRVWWAAINETIYTADNPESVTTVGNWVKSLVKRSFGNRTANNYSHLHSCNADFVMIPRTEMQSVARASTREIGLYFRSTKLKVTTVLTRITGSTTVVHFTLHI